MSYVIAIVDDEEDILELISINIKRSGFIPKKFVSRADFFNFLDKYIPDLVILDIMLPDSSGFDICRKLRSMDKYKDIPVIMLTAKVDENDKVLGLEIGADDYITKPFSSKELIARVKAVLRRYSKKDSNYNTNEDNIINIDDKVYINENTYEVSIEGNDTHLTFAEFKILLTLSQRRGTVFNRDNLLNHIWGEEKNVVDRTIDVHIRNLRKKLGIYGDIIENIRGVGYKIK